MLRVKTKLGLSSIEGLGLFADEYLKEGTLIWALDRDFDRTISDADLSKLPGLAVEAVLKYSYRCNITGERIVCGDDARFMNHSDNSNTKDTPDGTVALRDIAPGEEITANYFEFDQDAVRHLGRR